MFNGKTTLAAAAVTSLAALSVTGVASAAMVRGSVATTSPVVSGTTSTALRTTPSIPIPPPVTTGTTSVALSAFPAGGKGSGTEATCQLWSGQL
ncbi:MAG: hypothetical protein ACXVVU_25820, partial [Solirubrobacteraceae bacterium]